MVHVHKIVLPGKIKGSVCSESGEKLTPPENWAFLAAGDAAITRSVKAKGLVWVLTVPKGRRMISKGIWANGADILEAQNQIQVRRSTPEYARQREKDIARRHARQEAYVKEFFAQVVIFLDFHHRYEKEARLLGEKITAHATPVNSGTVARTKQIPIDGRVKGAVIAWMRHHTTAYDSMSIARIKGKRREVRRQLAVKSLEILQAYRRGSQILATCPLKKALNDFLF
ncbi:MAG: DUF2293 domain-containing protein [Desulfobacteraceae bacterium]|nr:DUF2293 domain-containing protein [Desulfobacteraceae bacterium]